MGQKPPAEEDMKRDKYKTKADVVAAVKSRLPKERLRSRQKAIKG